VAEAARALFAFGQQVLQQQPSGEQPTVCFAMVPLLIPAALIVAHTIGRKIRRLAARPA
jgi:peptidoglycan/LPS O-acetylase OafA/YrhL